MGNLQIHHLWQESNRRPLTNTVTLAKTKTNKKGLFLISVHSFLLRQQSCWLATVRLKCVFFSRHPTSYMACSRLIWSCVQASPWDKGFLWLHVPSAGGSAHERWSGQPHRIGHSGALAWGEGQPVHLFVDVFGSLHTGYSLSIYLSRCNPFIFSVCPTYLLILVP